MCTASYCPTTTGWLLTFSRDEQLARKTAIPPYLQQINGIDILAPKDAEAGGTWIGANAKGTTVCLLNGAFEKHSREPYYRLSRGQVVLDLLASDQPYVELQQYNLQQIEPFTLILRTQKHFMENRWDGTRLHQKSLNPNEYYIWSSATLYSQPIRQYREQEFLAWSKANLALKTNLIDFHHHAFQELDKENQVIMSRPKQNISTVSITSIEAVTDQKYFSYINLQTLEQTNSDIALVSESVPIA